MFPLPRVYAFSDSLGASRPIYDRCREFCGDGGLGRFLHSVLANPRSFLTCRNQPRDDCTEIHLLSGRNSCYTIFEKDNAITKVEPTKGVRATDCRRVSVSGSMLDVQINVSVNTGAQTTQCPVANRII